MAKPDKTTPRRAKAKKKGPSGGVIASREQSRTEIIAVLRDSLRDIADACAHAERMDSGVGASLKQLEGCALHAEALGLKKPPFVVGPMTECELCERFRPAPRIPNWATRTGQFFLLTGGCPLAVPERYLKMKRKSPLWWHGVVLSLHAAPLSFRQTLIPVIGSVSRKKAEFKIGGSIEYVEQGAADDASIRAEIRYHATAWLRWCECDADRVCSLDGAFDLNGSQAQIVLALVQSSGKLLKQQEIADAAELSLRAVQMHCPDLETIGVIERPLGRSSGYRLTTKGGSVAAMLGRALPLKPA